MINWSTRARSPRISDLEVESRTIQQQGSTTVALSSTRSPIEPGKFITVATTRPETMLGDMAVAVHPEDDRYKRRCTARRA